MQMQVVYCLTKQESRKIQNALNSGNYMPGQARSTLTRQARYLENQVKDRQGEWPGRERIQ